MNCGSNLLSPLLSILSGVPYTQFIPPQSFMKIVTLECELPWLLLRDPAGGDDDDESPAAVDWPAAGAAGGSGSEGTQALLPDDARGALHRIRQGLLAGATSGAPAAGAAGTEPMLLLQRMSPPPPPMAFLTPFSAIAAAVLLFRAGWLPVPPPCSCKSPVGLAHIQTSTDSISIVAWRDPSADSELDPIAEVAAASPTTGGRAAMSPTPKMTDDAIVVGSWLLPWPLEGVDPKAASTTNVDTKCEC